MDILQCVRAKCKLIWASKVGKTASIANLCLIHLPIESFIENVKHANKYLERCSVARGTLL